MIWTVIALVIGYVLGAWSWPKAKAWLGLTFGGPWMGGA